MASGGIQSAMANRSLRTIKSELEFLAEASVITPQQYSSILAQLPADTSSSVTSPAAETVTTPMANLRVASNDNTQGKGYFTPSPNVQPAQEHNVAPPAYPTAPQPPSALVYATALYSYNATDAGDLNLGANDRIAVTEYMNAEWWKGRSERTKEEGIFPRSYVRVEEKMPTGAGAAYRTTSNTSGASTNYGNVPLEVSQSGSGGPRQPGKGEEYGKKFGKKLGNAAVFGAGATIGGKIVNGIF